MGTCIGAMHYGGHANVGGLALRLTDVFIVYSGGCGVGHSGALGAFWFKAFKACDLPADIVKRSGDGRGPLPACITPAWRRQVLYRLKVFVPSKQQGELPLALATALCLQIILH